MKTERRDKRRQFILDQSKQRFLHEGFQKTSMRSIAQGCDLAVGTLYNYFRSKSDILLALFQDLIQRTAGAQGPIDPEEDHDLFLRISRLFLKYEKLYTSFPKEFWREVLAAQYLGELGSSGGLWATQGDFQQELSALVVPLSRTGLVKDDEIPTILSLLFGVFFMRFMAWINTNMAKEEFQFTMNEQINLILRGIGL